MDMTSEQRAAFNQAAHLFSLASGVSPAGAVDALKKDRQLLAKIAEGLRAMSPVSPLADQIDELTLKE